MAGGMHGGGVCMAGEMAIAADSTHPTEVHSCLPIVFLFQIIDKESDLVLMDHGSEDWGQII